MTGFLSLALDPSEPSKMVRTVPIPDILSGEIWHESGLWFACWLVWTSPTGHRCLMRCPDPNDWKAEYSDSLTRQTGGYWTHDDSQSIAWLDVPTLLP